MSIAASVPLVNSASFPRHAGHTVRIWGTLQRLTDDVALVQACDQGTIEVILSPKSILPSLQTNQLVEVLAKVSPDGAVAREFQSYALPDEKSLSTSRVAPGPLDSRLPPPLAPTRSAASAPGNGSSTDGVRTSAAEMDQVQQLIELQYKFPTLFGA